MHAKKIQAEIGANRGGGGGNHSTELEALTSSKSNISLISLISPTHPQRKLLGGIWTWEECERALSSPVMLCVGNVWIARLHFCMAWKARLLCQVKRHHRLRGKSEIHLSLGKNGYMAVMKWWFCRENKIYLHVWTCMLHYYFFFFFSCCVRLHKQTYFKQFHSHGIFHEWDLSFYWFVDFRVTHLDLFVFLLLHTVVEMEIPKFAQVAMTSSSLALISLTAAGWVLPFLFDRFRQSHWVRGSSSYSFEICDQKAWSCKFSSAHMYCTTG